jgi:hypothetical protein
MNISGIDHTDKKEFMSFSDKERKTTIQVFVVERVL